MALIHKFKQGGNFFVLDVNTGAVHVVDELVYDILDDNRLANQGENATWQPPKPIRSKYKPYFRFNGTERTPLYARTSSPSKADCLNNGVLHI